MVADNKRMIFEEMAQNFYLISPISLDNEIKVLLFLQGLIKNHLSKYKTSLEVKYIIIYKQDTNILNTEKPSNNIRNCILMRMGEKKVLNYFLHFTEYCLDLFKYDKEEVTIL